MKKNLKQLRLIEKRLYVLLQFFFHLSIKKNTDKSQLISEYFPDLTPQLILFRTEKVSKLSNLRTFSRVLLALVLFYKFSCANCASVYVGSTVRTSHTRVCEHKGLGDRTGKPSTAPKLSAIRVYAMICTSDISTERFKIIAIYSK